MQQIFDKPLSFEIQYINTRHGNFDCKGISGMRTGTILGVERLVSFVFKSPATCRRAVASRTIPK